MVGVIITPVARHLSQIGFQQSTGFPKLFEQLEIVVVAMASWREEN